MASGDQGPVEELADKSAQVVIAGANEAWPYRKVLLAILPPTVALLIAVLGLWESSQRDRANAEQAEAKRTFEAQADRQLREAQLVLPKYETLVRDAQNFRIAAGRCLDEIQPWLAENPAFELTEDDRLELLTWADVPPVPGGIPEDQLIPWPVPSEIHDACSEIHSAFEPLEISLDLALLVSNPVLEARAERLVEQFRELEVRSRHLLDRLEPDACSPTCVALPFWSEASSSPGDYYALVSGVDERGCCFWFEDGTPTASQFFALDQALTNVPELSRCLVQSVRGVVLEQQAQESSTADC